MEFRLLGLLEIVENGRALPIAHGKESALLAILLLHANEPVSADRLIHELWVERAPENAGKNVQQYVSRLRRHFGADRLATTPGGYLLRVDPDELDLDHFDRVATAGRSALLSGDAAAAEALFSNALSLWRGPVLADFRYDDFAQDAIRRFEGDGRQVRSDRVEARLALGREDGVLAELQELIDDDPHWERPRGQLMLALYRAGRQSDALDVYRATREVFDTEFGLEPSRELQALERSILNHDAALGRPSLLRHRRGPAVRAGRLSLLRHRRGPAIYLVAGVGLIVAAVAAAALVVLSGSSSSTLGNAVAAVDASGHLISYTSAGTTPGNIVVGEGGVWVLNADDRTITKIDPTTRRVVKTFATNGGLPTDLAVGDGAIWVGSSQTSQALIESNSTTTVVSRLDPTSTTLAGSADLPGAASPFRLSQTLGVSGIAVDTQAVWAVDPDGSISRIDPRTGRLVAQINARRATAIAAGDVGVWFLTTTSHGMPEVAHIDPRTNTVDETTPVDTPDLVGVAIGAGSIWATDPYAGLIWRITPGLASARTISVGFGATQISFGGGVVWTTNLATGTVSRVDPRTDDVVTTRQLAGTPQALAAGAGSAWVSIAGGTNTGSLPATDCRPLESGGARPDLLVASDLPLQGALVAPTFAAAVRFVLRSNGFRAGRFTVGYQSCDDSTARSQGFDFFKCATNARDFGAAAKLVAVIGPYDSGCAQIEIPVMNRASAGAVALISPSNTLPPLTRAEPWAGGAPQIYYPTGARNFLRVASPDDLQGAAEAVLAKQLHVRRVALLSDGEPYGDALVRGFRAAARRLGVKVVAAGDWDPGARDDRGLVAKVARSRAEGVLIAGYELGAGPLVRALRARFGARLTLIAGDGFLGIPDTLQDAGPAAKGMYVSESLVTPESLTPAGRRLLSAFEKTQPGGLVTSGTYLPEVLESAELVIDAIARSDGTRASVLKQLRLSNVNTGFFGGFHFDRNGDITPSPFTIFRITGGQGTPGLVPDYRGSVVDRTIRVPVSLLGTASIRSP